MTLCEACVIYETSLPFCAVCSTRSYYRLTLLNEEINMAGGWRMNCIWAPFVRMWWQDHARIARFAPALESAIVWKCGKKSAISADPETSRFYWFQFEEQSRKDLRLQCTFPLPHMILYVEQCLEQLLEFLGDFGFCSFLRGEINVIQQNSTWSESNFWMIARDWPDGCQPKNAIC